MTLSPFCHQPRLAIVAAVFCGGNCRPWRLEGVEPIGRLGGAIRGDSKGGTPPFHSIPLPTCVVGRG